MRKGKVMVLAAIMAAGVVTAEAQPFRQTVQPAFIGPGSPMSPSTMFEAPGMPPPPRMQVIPRSPGPRFVWAPGTWAWNGGWGWVPGAWVPPPRGRSVWTPGRWNRRGRGAVWVGGSWR